MMKKFILIITALVMIVSVAVQSHAQSFRDQTLFGRVLDEKGEIRPGLMMSDNLHPIAPGYEIWLEAMCPVVDKLIE